MVLYLTENTSSYNNGLGIVKVVVLSWATTLFRSKIITTITTCQFPFPFYFLPIIILIYVCVVLSQFSSITKWTIQCFTITTLIIFTTLQLCHPLLLGFVVKGMSATGTLSLSVAKFDFYFYMNRNFWSSINMNK